MACQDNRNWLRGGRLVEDTKFVSKQITINTADYSVFLAAIAAQEAILSVRTYVCTYVRTSVTKLCFCNFWQLLAAVGICWQLFWQLLVTFGNFLQHLATFGNYWQLLATIGNFWQLLATNDNLWQLLATYGNFWQLMETFDNFWELLANIGNF